MAGRRAQDNKKKVTHQGGDKHSEKEVSHLVSPHRVLPNSPLKKTPLYYYFFHLSLFQRFFNNNESAFPFSYIFKP